MTEDWTPRGIDSHTPSTARIYDYLLGGKDNFAADRAAGDKILENHPDVRKTLLANRGFLVNTARTLADEGIDQFIDLGTGIPTSPNVHEIAQQANPEARVIYVDNDPIVTAHSRALRTGNSQIGVIEHDLRDPEGIINDPELTSLIDWERPVAVLMVAVLHFLAREKPEEIIGAFTRHMAPGSYLALSVATSEGLSEKEQDDLRKVYAGSTATGADLMSPSQITGLFSGFELLEPGVEPAWWWCDDSGLDTKLTVLAGRGRRV